MKVKHLFLSLIKPEIQDLKGQVIIEKLSVDAPIFFSEKQINRIKWMEEFMRNAPKPFPAFECVSNTASIQFEFSIHTDSCTIMFSTVFSIIFASTLQNEKKSNFDT